MNNLTLAHAKFITWTAQVFGGFQWNGCQQRREWRAFQPSLSCQEAGFVAGANLFWGLNWIRVLTPCVSYHIHYHYYYDYYDYYDDYYYVHVLFSVFSSAARLVTALTATASGKEFDVSAWIATDAKNINVDPQGANWIWQQRMSLTYYLIS